MRESWLCFTFGWSPHPTHLYFLWEISNGQFHKVLPFWNAFIRRIFSFVNKKIRHSISSLWVFVFFLRWQWRVVCLCRSPCDVAVCVYVCAAQKSSELLDRAAAKQWEDKIPQRCPEPQIPNVAHPERVGQAGERAYVHTCLMGLPTAFQIQYGSVSFSVRRAHCYCCVCVCVRARPLSARPRLFLSSLP